MRILHITETRDGASGVATFVRELDGLLRARGVKSNVICSGGNLDEAAVGGKIDVLHIHGLWLGMYHKAAKWAKRRGIPVVWSTHGMTAPWSMRHKWWKKRIAWWLYQRLDLQQAVTIHCTTELEVGWNKALGFKKCFVAPLGTEIEPRNTQNTRKKEKRVLLFVGRIYPVKGLMNLVQAWGLIEPRNTPTTQNWVLRIVGPDEAGHKAELVRLVDELDLGDNVVFAGPKFGAELSAEYENCDCLVLPSFTENFGATIVDALVHGKPCIASIFTPWQILEECGCGWWVSNEPEKLAAAIREMISAGDDVRRNMGAKGCKLVEEKYTWNAVAHTMINEYQKVISSCQ